MAVTLEGNWQSGLAFDLHTISSTYIGVNEHGYDQFDTIRSEMGELVHRLKYRFDKSALEEIVKLLEAIGGIENFDYLVPIPPTKKTRPFQPVELIARALGEHRKVQAWPGLLLNEGNEELKGISDPVERLERLRVAIKLAKGADVSGRKILLVDDLYRSGTTLRVATDLLYKTGKAAKVSVLTMTMTRSNR